MVVFFAFFILWLDMTRHNRQVCDAGVNAFSIIAYIVALVWMIASYRNRKNQQRFFWLFFACGIGFLLISKFVSAYNEQRFGLPHSPVEDSIRLVGYLFFFTGFIYQVKVLKSTLPMLRFLLNIIIVITAVYSVSWYFIVDPVLKDNDANTPVGFFLSSTYHVFNISLLFAAVSLIFLSHPKQNKTSLYLIAVGFFIQIIGDFFYINHVRHMGDWTFLLWPMSALIMGLGAVFSNEYDSNSGKEDERLEYKNYHLSLIVTGILLLFTFYNQLSETNILQKGLDLTVLLLMAQQVIAIRENQQIFTKLKRLVYSDGDYRRKKQADARQNNEMAKLLSKIETLAHYDPLTNLPNRNLFQKSLAEELKRSEEKGLKFSLMYIDLDRFKNVNDSLGHDCGDLLLKEVANRLTQAVPQTATVARIGGDEFAIILPETDIKDLKKIAHAILHQFQSAIPVQVYELYTTPSIGISLYPEGGRSAGDLLKSADAAMYSAKEAGRNKYHFFNPRRSETIVKKMQMESRLRRALEENHFVLYYQPQFDLRTNQMVGVEALIRWNDPELGMVFPDKFIPLAEETGLIEPIGLWVIDTACRQLKSWHRRGLFPDMTMSVNVSIRQFYNHQFVHEVKKIVTAADVDPRYLKIEITESVLQDIHKTAHVLNELTAFGIQIAIDDFGTGYSSLSYLKNLPVSFLKIDKAFIDELSENADGPIVKTIIDMGRNLDFTVIAEGVETKDHVSFLLNHQCFVGQGYLFSKPLPAADLEKKITNVRKPAPFPAVG